MTVSYKTALITGASSGLGRGLARWFAAQGVHVYGAARRESELASVAEECAKAGGTFEPVPLDVAQTHAAIEQIRAIDDRSGGLDLIIANAGVGLDSPAKALDWDKVERTLQVNVTGAAATLCAVLPRMVERNRGHLVGISSLASYRGLPKNAAYSASKAFVRVFLEGLRVDLQGTGVAVTSIQPGFVKTEMTAANKFPMPFLLESEDACEQMARAIVRREAEFDFPWQLSGAMKLAKVMPNAMWDLAARRMK